MTDEVPVSSTTAASVPVDPVNKKESVSTEPACEMEEATNGTSTTNGSSGHKEEEESPEK